MQKKICIIMLIFLTVSCNPLLAYEGKVHAKIDEEAASPDNSSLHDILIYQLRYEDGINTTLGKDNIGKKFFEH